MSRRFMLRRLRTAIIRSMKNPHAVALGKLGGAKGGRVRAERLSRERRREIARTAASSRWTGRLPDSLRSAFSQDGFEELSTVTDRELVFWQVLTSGRSDHVAWLRRRFGDEVIEEWIRGREARGLTTEQVALWIPLDTIRRWHQTSTASTRAPLVGSGVGRHNSGSRSEPLKDSQQEERALREREANALAASEGQSLPFPNMWDALDPTKVDRDATPAQVHDSYLRFTALCRPRPRKSHRL